MIDTHSYNGIELSSSVDVNPETDVYSFLQCCIKPATYRSRKVGVEVGVDDIVIERHCSRLKATKPHILQVFESNKRAVFHLQTWWGCNVLLCPKPACTALHLSEGHVHIT